MIKNKNKKSRMILTVALVTVAVLTLGIIGAASLSVPVWSDISVEAEYDYGTEFQVPSRTVSVSGKTENAECVIIYPDGSVVSKDKIILSISGVYTLRYSATVDGSFFSKDEKFVVPDNLYSFSSNKSSAVYDEASGLKVLLAEGDTMYFNSVIDLTSITSLETLMEVLVTPQNDGQSDFGRLYFTFTDVTNPDSYITISARKSASTGSEAWRYTYLMVAGDNQLLTGIEPWNGEFKKHVEGASDFGRPIQHSFSKNETNATDTLVIQYDAKTTSAYVKNQLIATLSSPEHFTSLWSGFASGKVRLSIKGAMYESPVASFLIKSVKDIDLSLEKINDKTGPEITVNSKFADSMPLAVKGMKYSVPTATAYDANTGFCSVKTSVWYNYSSLNKVQVTVEDGWFETSRIGKYAIVYESSDKFGNTATEILWIDSRESVALPTVEISSDRVTSVTLGEFITPADYTAFADSGDASVTISVKFGNEEYGLEARGFRPEKQGTYTVVYTATDYVGQVGVYTYEVTAVPGAPLFADVSSLPKIFIDGCEYKLPEIYVNDYSSGVLERKLVAPKVTDSKGTNTANSNKITPTVENSGDKITLLYEYNGAESISFEIPVIKAWELYKGIKVLTVHNYLYSENGGITVTKTDSNIGITAESADASWLFANSLVAEQFELVLSSVNGKSGYKSLNIRLIDAENPNLSVMAKLINNGANNAGIQIGDLTSTFSKNFASDNQFVFKYANEKISVGEFTFEVDKYENGDDFNGFPSGKIYFEVGFEDASAGAQYNLISVNGHRMTTLATDLTAPKIVVLGEYGGTYRPGQTVVIPAALAGDTLDPNTVWHVTVLDTNGNIAVSADGTRLDKADATKAYELNVDSYGQYIVRIHAEDTFNDKPNAYNWQYAINVTDDVLPEIKFEEEIKSTASVGDVLVLPDFTVSDNMTAAEDIKVAIFVYTPSGRLVYLEGDSNSIVASQKGVYEFRIYVSDKEGNLNLVRKSVTVE